eukprot:691695-Prorocentrum_minimum.AAC.1
MVGEARWGRDGLDVDGWGGSGADSVILSFWQRRCFVEWGDRGLHTTKHVVKSTVSLTDGCPRLRAAGRRAPTFGHSSSSPPPASTRSSSSSAARGGARGRALRGKPRHKGCVTTPPRPFAESNLALAESKFA